MPTERKSTVRWLPANRIEALRSRVAISDTSLFRHRTHIETALTEAKAVVEEWYADDPRAAGSPLSRFPTKNMYRTEV